MFSWRQIRNPNWGTRAKQRQRIRSGASCPTPPFGHPRLHDDVEPVLNFGSLKARVESRLGDGRKTAIYNMAAHLRWKRARGLPDDSDR